jgi:hypothetical protein
MLEVTWHARALRRAEQSDLGRQRARAYCCCCCCCVCSMAAWTHEGRILGLATSTFDRLTFLSFFSAPGSAPELLSSEDPWMMGELFMLALALQAAPWDGRKGGSSLTNVGSGMGSSWLSRIGVERLVRRASTKRRGEPMDPGEPDTLTQAASVALACSTGTCLRVCPSSPSWTHFEAHENEPCGSCVGGAYATRRLMPSKASRATNSALLP